MSFLSKILGYRDFSKKNEILEELRKYKFEKFGDSENLDDTHHLIFFKTRRQQTWLVATNQNLYCVLDDISLNTFDIKWNISKQNLIDQDKVILTISVVSEYSENSGKINFGERHKGWLYSKSIFKEPKELKQAIHNLLMSAMT